MVRSIIIEIKRILKGILIFSMLILILTWLLIHCPPLCVMALGGGVVLIGWVMGE